MRYQTFKVKLECGCRRYVVVDTAIGIEIGEFATAKEAQTFREQRQRTDQLSTTP